MMGEHSEEIRSGLERIENNEKGFIQLGAATLEADNRSLFPFDFLATAAVNRALALSKGFRRMIMERNMICAGALLRLQLDTALRFSAGFLVEKPHDFATMVQNGDRIDKMKDRSGNKMTDKYLVQQLMVKHPWIEEVYERTSGYIHFSSTHISSVLTDFDDETRSVGIRVSADDNELPDDIYLGAIGAFLDSTKVLALHLHGWIFTKDNPEVVAAWKLEREKAAQEALAQIEA